MVGELLKKDPQRWVVSVHGPGGSGKTSLVTSLYNSMEVQAEFQCRAWTCVSQEYNIEDVLRSVIISLKKKSSYHTEIKERTLELLERHLHELLKESKYLIVVDDVWNTKVWDSLKRSFPDCNNGSRVIVTTRYKGVATGTGNPTYAHQIRLLHEKESLELFLKNLCLDNKWPVWCSEDMQKLGKEMVEKCSGLPLALIVLGGLLAHNPSLGEWQKVREKIWRKLSNNSIDISFLLSLSYNDLSMELKKCFLYFGTFPEDYIISSRELTYSWTAEEFMGEGDMEDIAASHLNELVNRNLVQVEREMWSSKEYKTHDLLRDLAIVKASEIKLFDDIYNPSVTQPSPHDTRSHVISTPNIQRYVTTDDYNTKLQSLMMYNKHGLESALLSPQLIDRLGKFNDLTILKLVRFKNNTQPELWNTIGNLLKLKYLSLESTGNIMIYLPPSIGNLKRLQTLEVRSASCNLPSKISNLKDLRHLDCSGIIKGNVARIGNLSGLQTLRKISYGHWTTIRTYNLINLRHLVIDGIEEQNGKACSLESIGMLESLHTLQLFGDVDLPPIDFISSLHNLSVLYLKGKIKRLPPAEKWPKFLTKLTLYRSEFEESPIPTIEKLSNLKSLRLWDTHKTRIMSFSSKCLPQLEFLSLSDFPNLKEVKVEGAMPIIKRIYIDRCNKLKNNIVPNQLKSIIIHEMFY